MSRVRVNVTVDSDLLEKAKGKLDLFGGKLSTLFNRYLQEFVESSEKKYSDEHTFIINKLKELESRMQKMEKKNV